MTVKAPRLTQPLPNDVAHVVSQCAKKLDDIIVLTSRLSSGIDQTKIRDATPAVIVVGMQNHGKSSVLKMITGLDMHIATLLATKRPLLIHLRRGKPGTATTFTFTPDISSPEDAFRTARTIARADVANEVAKEQERTSEQLRAKNPSGIVDLPITLCVEGPDQLWDITLVDLPGINADNRTATMDIVRARIQAEQAIILLVQQACEDPANSDAYKLVNKADPGCRRTVCVLTKVDKESLDDVDTMVMQLKTACKMREIVAMQANVSVDQERDFFASDGKFLDLKARLVQRGEQDALQYGTATLVRKIAERFDRASSAACAPLARMFEDMLAQYDCLLRGIPDDVSKALPAIWMKLTSDVGTLLNDRNLERIGDDRSASYEDNTHRIQDKLWTDCEALLKDVEFPVLHDMLNNTPAAEEARVDFRKRMEPVGGIPGMWARDLVKEVTRFAGKLAADSLDGKDGGKFKLVCKTKQYLEDLLKQAVDHAFKHHEALRAELEMAVRAAIINVLTACFCELDATLTTILKDVTFNNSGTVTVQFRHMQMMMDNLLSSQDVKLAKGDGQLAYLQVAIDACWNSGGAADAESRNIPSGEEKALFQKFCAYWLTMVPALVDTIGKCIFRQIFERLPNMISEGQSGVFKGSLEAKLKDISDKRKLFESDRKIIADARACLD